MIRTPAEGTRHDIRQKLTTANATTIYTGSAKIRAIIAAINFCNITGGAVTVDLWINDGSSDFYFMKGFTVNGVTSFMDVPATIENGDTLKVQASGANIIDVVGVIVEQTPQTSRHGP